MADLTVNIVTPEKVVFSGPATEVRVPGWNGEFGVLAGHAPLLALLRAGITTVNTPEGPKRFITGRGFSEAGGHQVVILADSFESGEGVDKGLARKQYEEAERIIADTAAESGERMRAEQLAELARARLDF